MFIKIDPKNTARTVGCDLSTCTAAATWNESQAPCI